MTMGNETTSPNLLSSSARARASCRAEREEQPQISVVVATYNRSDMLRESLDSLAALEPSEISFEILVVDNNSKDDTFQTVQTYIERDDLAIRYLFEDRQGVAFARNTGVAAARAPIVAFIDDDVQVTPGWLKRMHQAFGDHPEVAFVGGKVLPRWEGTPPAWLTPDHWAPLGLIDLGDESFQVDLQRPRCLLSGNLGIRRSVFLDFGGFTPKFQRVRDGIGSLEDREFEMRLYDGGQRGLYLPDLQATSIVPKSRMEKAYHRRWHAGHGAFCAQLQLLRVPEGGVSWYGVARYQYAALPRLGLSYLGSVLKGREGEALTRECELRFTWAYMRMAWRLHRECAPPDLVQKWPQFLRRGSRKGASGTPLG